mmetsp:Transcript_34439/g.112538  ORF Transcript_34439/g.112538 Transcript_34439/m.112538 type:complete len:85 (-) Transcript_34439:195-449(-)
MASRCLTVDRSGTPGEGAASLLRETLELRDRELAAARQQLTAQEEAHAETVSSLQAQLQAARREASEARRESKTPAGSARRFLE